MSTHIKAQDVFGKWKTIDDLTGETKSLVEIYKKSGFAYGRVLELYRSAEKDQDPVCSRCPKDDDRYNAKIKGMDVIRGLMPDMKAWSEGTLLDPKSGTIYSCKIWLDENDPNKLKVRAYSLFFYRTQTWIRL